MRKSRQGQHYEGCLCASQRHSNLFGTQFSPQWNEHDEGLVKIKRTNARADLYTTPGISLALREPQLLHPENHRKSL